MTISEGISGPIGLYKRIFRLFALCMIFLFMPFASVAAPYAAYVMDARTGQELHAENADARLHPASLTKMMTLYIAFEAIERGEISADTLVTISANAAKEPPSKLGLRSGQKIKLRYLIRAAAVKSANDAATAIGEAISGSEVKFAARMNRTAKAIGMTRTHFKNANGLTQEGHLSTARDMSLLGRQLFYDYPQYYHLFTRTTAEIPGKKLLHTNRRFLNDYRGADGIKTGYTNAAGYNLTASAERGSERIIATVFGGRSTTQRNNQVAKLMDLGFKKAPSRVALRKPPRPDYNAPARRLTAATSMTSSLRPQPRPGVQEENLPAIDRGSIVAALGQALNAASEETQMQMALVDPARPVARPAQIEGAPQEGSRSVRNELHQAIGASLQEMQKEAVARVISRSHLKGPKDFGVAVGRFKTTRLAERMLITTAMKEMESLSGTTRKVIRRVNGYEAGFLGMSKEEADLACRRLRAKNIECTTIDNV